MNVIVRRTGIVVGSLALVVVLLGAGVYFTSEGRVNTKIVVASESVSVPTDSASVARGRHIANAITKCTDCHTSDLGGQVMVDVVPMGRWVSMNLTRGKGGIGNELSDADIVRAVRHGIGRDGRKLKLMPATSFTHLSAEDLGAIIAYVRSVAPVNRELPSSSLGPVARALIVAGKFPLYDADEVDHTAKFETAPAVGPTVEYGGYIANVGGCKGCHGATLAGGKIATGDPSWPPAANLTPTGIKTRYTEETFFKVLRTGIKPEGGTLNDAMPWRWTRDMTDDEIRAVWAFLQTVPPREFGAR